MTVAVTVNLKTAAGANIAGVVVYVYNTSEVLQAGSPQTTDANGNAVFTLLGSAAGTKFIVRLWAPTYVVVGGTTQEINVVEPVGLILNTFDIVADLRVLKASIDPRMCTLTGYFVDASLRPYQGTSFEFKPVAGFVGELPSTPAATPAIPAIVRDRTIISPITATPNKAGYLTIELPRLSLIEVHMMGLEHPFTGTERINIPDAASALLEDVLFPFVRTVAYAASPITVAAGVTANNALTVTLSDGRLLTLKSEYEKLLTFTPADPTIALAAMIDGSLAITGVLAGSTTVAVARIAKTFASHSPALAAPAAALTVTVT
jgi:hypothetical protein